VEPFASAEDAQTFIIRAVYDTFLRTGEWPRVRDFDIEYGDVLDPFDGVELLCRRLGHEFISCGSPQSENDRIMVRLRALAGLPEAKHDIEHFLCAVRLAARLYREKKGSHEVNVTPGDVRGECKLEEEQLKRAFALLQSSEVSAGGSVAAIRVGHIARKLADVSSIDDYFNRLKADDARRLALASANVARPGKPPRPQPLAVDRLFLSHAADDATLANYLADTLRKGSPKLNVFVASRVGDIPTGEEWLAKIRSELKRADAYLVLLTPVSITRKWIWYETGAAWWSEKRLIPVVAAGLKKSDVPLPLGAHQALSLDEPADVAQLARDIGSDIDDPVAFCDGLRAIYRTRPEPPKTDEEWKSVDVDGRSFAWDGPLYQLDERDEGVPTPPGLIEALKAAQLTAQYGPVGNLRRYRAQGFVPVYETDRRTWRRSLLSVDDGDQILLVRPNGA
jgi:hypothetical protein